MTSLYERYKVVGVEFSNNRVYILGLKCLQGTREDEFINQINKTVSQFINMTWKLITR